MRKSKNVRPYTRAPRHPIPSHFIPPRPILRYDPLSHLYEITADEPPRPLPLHCRVSNYFCWHLPTSRANPPIRVSEQLPQPSPSFSPSPWPMAPYLPIMTAEDQGKPGQTDKRALLVSH